MRLESKMNWKVSEVSADKENTLYRNIHNGKTIWVVRPSNMSAPTTPNGGYRSRNLAIAWYGDVFKESE
jgi:hypothetical protein